MSQRASAAATGQSQSKVSDILRKKRRITSYEVLVRIAEGFNLPPGWLGLAFDPDTESCWAAPTPDRPKRNGLVPRRRTRPFLS